MATGGFWFLALTGPRGISSTDSGHLTLVLPPLASADGAEGQKSGPEANFLKARGLFTFPISILTHPEKLPTSLAMMSSIILQASLWDSLRLVWDKQSCPRDHQFCCAPLCSSQSKPWASL